MSDHLDFIRIRGLQASDAEVFQGIGGSMFTATVEPGAAETTTALEWGEIPQEAVELISKYTTDLNSWISQARATTRKLSKSRDITDLVPYVPLIIETVATGGTNLPAVAVTMLSQAILNQAGAAVENYAASLDENSPANLFKKAFLYNDQAEQKSILGKALLEDVNGEPAGVLRLTADEIIEKLKDLRYNDEEIDFGPFRVWLRGKMIEY